MLGATGVARALTELSSVSQVWSTSYGRALIVKTAIFVPLLGVGWLNRTHLLDVFTRLRRSVTVELVAIAGIVVAVAILTELRPRGHAERACELANVCDRTATGASATERSRGRARARLRRGRGCPGGEPHDRDGARTGRNGARRDFRTASPVCGACYYGA